MNQRRSASITTLAILFALVVLVGLIWANLFYINLEPVQSSFLPRWLGTRIFLTEGISPYSPQVTARIEQAQKTGDTSLAAGSSLYLYPFHSFLVYAPFALTDNLPAARTAWMTLLEIGLFSLLAASLLLSRWRAAFWAIVLVSLFSITWYYGLRPLLDGDLAILVGLACALSLIAIKTGHDALGGFLLALALTKPVPVIFLVVFVFVWAGSQQRWIVVWSCLGSLALIVAATSLFIPDWVAQNIRQVVQFLQLPQTNTPGTLLAAWLPGIGRQAGWLITIVCLSLLAWEWVQAFRKDFRWFYWCACLTLAVSPLIGLPTSLNNFIIMYPGLVLILSVWDERWGRLGKALLLLSLLVLSFGVWWLVVTSAQNGMPADQNPWLFFALPVFLIAGLYWVRWWAIQPPRLPLQEIPGDL